MCGNLFGLQQISHYCVLAMLLIFFAISSLFVATGATSNTIKFEILEEVPEGSVVANLIEVPQLKSSYNITILRATAFSIRLDDNIAEGAFKVDGHYLQVGRQIDRDEICPQLEQCVLAIKLFMMLPNNNFDMRELQIVVKDINDSPPTFAGPIYVEVSEASTVGSTFSLPAAIDRDAPEHGLKGYKLQEDGQLSYFDVLLDVSTGTAQLRLLQALDREKKDRYNMLLTAYDRGSPVLNSTVHLNVTVLDDNDQSPVFDQAEYSASVVEGSTGLLSIVHAKDADLGKNGHVRYYLVGNQELRQHFLVDPMTGEVRVTKPLDYDVKSNYSLRVSAVDGGQPPLTGYTTVNVTVIDVNDHHPNVTWDWQSQSRFGISNDATRQSVSKGNGNASVVSVARLRENAPNNSFVTYFSVTDKDSGLGGVVKCRLEPAADGSHNFTLSPIGSNGYKITSNVKFNYESIQETNITVLCEDAGTPLLSTHRLLRVDIIDENDHSPLFAKPEYLLSILENAPVGSAPMTINAEDLDSGENGRITYTIEPTDPNFPKSFKIDPDRGTISVAEPLDREKFQFLVYRITATDNGSPARSTSTQLTVELMDVNDNPPQFSKPAYRFQVYENGPSEEEIGQISATDPDATASPNMVQLYLDVNVDGSSAFSLRPDGRLLVMGPLDRENRENYRLQVVATDQGRPPATSRAEILVTVLDRNDNAPKVSWPISDLNDTVYLSYKAPIGAMVAQIVATDDDTGPNGLVTYEVFQGNEKGHFFVDNLSGVVRLMDELTPADKGEYRITVIIGDSSETMKRLTVVKTFVIHVTDPSGMPSDQFLFQGPLSDSSIVILLLVLCSAAVALCMVIFIIVLKYRFIKRRQGHRRGSAAVGLPVDDDDAERASCLCATGPAMSKRPPPREIELQSPSESAAKGERQYYMNVATVGSKEQSPTPTGSSTATPLLPDLTKCIYQKRAVLNNNDRYSTNSSTITNENAHPTPASAGLHGRVEIKFHDYPEHFVTRQASPQDSGKGSEASDSVEVDLQQEAGQQPASGANLMPHMSTFKTYKPPMSTLPSPSSTPMAQSCYETLSPSAATRPAVVQRPGIPVVQHFVTSPTESEHSSEGEQLVSFTSQGRNDASSTVLQQYTVV